MKRKRQQILSITLCTLLFFSQLGGNARIFALAKEGSQELPVSEIAPKVDVEEPLIEEEESQDSAVEDELKEIDLEEELTDNLLSGGESGIIYISEYYANKKYSDDATAKTIEEFKHGEVAHLLGNFGQALGADDHPVSNGEKVYKINFSTNIENLIIELSLMYINSSLPKMPNLTGEAVADLSESLDYLAMRDGQIINRTAISSDQELRIVRGFYPHSNGIREGQS